MSAVATTKTPGGENDSGVSLSVLQDILYDIVATGGADASADVPLQDVERFLHEHARTPKSRAEFLAFFEAHGLPTQLTPTVVGISAPAPLSEAPQRPGPAPMQLAAAAAHGAETPDAPDSLMLPPEPREPVTGAFRVERTRTPTGVLALLGGIALLLGGAIGMGYHVYASMQVELREARALGQRQQRVIETLDSRTRELSAQVAHNGDVIEHVDTRSELLVDSLLPAPLQRPAPSN